MKKFLKNICCTALCIVLLFCLPSCHQAEDDYFDDERFQRGVEHGVEDTFLRMYNAVGFYNDETLMFGDTWNTKHFSLTIVDYEVKGDKYLFYNLNLQKTTVGKCYEGESLFFYIYAISDTDGIVLSGDDYYYDGILEYDGDTDDYLNGKIINGKVKLFDNSSAQTMLIIIMIDGSVYTATYEM